MVRPPLELWSDLWTKTHPSVVSTHVGLSGAVVFKVIGGNSTFALKAYPHDWGTDEQLAQIHSRVVAAGVDLIPQPLRTRIGNTVVGYDGVLWDLTAWRAGEPHQVGGATFEACARLHTRWSQPPQAVHPCPTVLRQWQVMSSSDVITVRSKSDLDEAITIAESRKAHTIEQLRAWLERPVPMQTIHGDLWPGNVLTRLNQTTLIDCAAIRTDSVCSDLARLSESHSNVELNELISQHYEPIRPLRPVEWELLQTLRQTGPVSRLVQWLNWKLIERRTFADEQVASKRFNDIVAHVRNLDLV